MFRDPAPPGPAIIAAQVRMAGKRARQRVVADVAEVFPFAVPKFTQRVLVR